MVADDSRGPRPREAAPDVEWLLPIMRKAEFDAFGGGLCSDALLRDLARAIVAPLIAGYEDRIARLQAQLREINVQWCKAIIPEGPEAIERITRRVNELRAGPPSGGAPTNG